MVQLILKKHLKVRKIFARWVPHLLTDEQNRQRDKVAKNMLQMFQTCDKKQFANVVIGNENWIYYFEPVRKFSNKIWASTHSSHPIIAKRSLSARKVWYAIFFSGEGVAKKVLMENGNKHHRKAQQRQSTGEAEKYQKQRPVTGFKHICLPHGNVPALASEIVTASWKKEKVSVLPHLPYSLDLALCDFFMFPKGPRTVSYSICPNFDSLWLA